MTKQLYQQLVDDRYQRLDDIALSLGRWHLADGETVDAVNDNLESDLEIIKKL